MAYADRLPGGTDACVMRCAILLRPTGMCGTGDRGVEADEGASQVSAKSNAFTALLAQICTEKAADCICLAAPCL
eukprot:1847015-Rhodomonas_salina.1